MQPLAWQKSLMLFLLSAGCMATMSLSRAKAAPAVPLEVLEPAERKTAIKEFPVSVGLMFPEGELGTGMGGKLMDDQKRAVPFESKVTGWWSSEKKEAKWLLVQFKASTDRRYQFIPGSKPAAPKGELLAVEKDGVVTVNTGPLAVKLSKNGGQLFDEAILNGKPILEGQTDSLGLTAGEGTVHLPQKEGDWSVTLEEATPMRAVVKFSGLLTGAKGSEPLARLDVRCQFFVGESWVRVYHTLTWLVKNPKVGAKDLSLRLKPILGDEGTVRVGLSDYGEEAVETPWTAATSVVAHQDDVQHFSIREGEKLLKEDERLGGWMAVEGKDGRGVGVALRNLWQEFPKALAMEKGILRVKLWPDDGPAMSFLPEAIMPKSFYYAEAWKRCAFSKNVGHYAHEYADNPYFLYTAEGSSKTHEMAVYFYDQTSKRRMGEVNSVTQHPVVVRQDPKLVMRVLFMGFEVMPVNREKYPDIERAAEQLGRMAVGRWPLLHDYGHFRFGMMRWGTPGEGLYRWMDGTQYDQQLIPWLLFIRGGDRFFYEEGENTARFAMDLATNHFNTRGYPTGYEAAAGPMPFPWLPAHIGKHTKIHFLAYYYHLTGYERAREVMQEVIAGTKAVATGEKPRWGMGEGRETYNMNVFWVNAYEETGDPEIKDLARQWLDHTLDTQYSPELNTFKNPPIYLYTGLVLQDGLWKDSRLKAIMLKDLDGKGYPRLQDGGIRKLDDAVACQWAFRETKNERYAWIGWELARNVADLVPDHDWKSPTIPKYPYAGVELYKERLLPILVGASTMEKCRLRSDGPQLFRDLHVAFGTKMEEKDTPMAGTAFIRPQQDGDLTLKVLLRDRWEGKIPPVIVSVNGTDGSRLAETKVQSETGGVPSSDDRWWRPPGVRGELQLSGARKGDCYQVDVSGGNRHTAVCLLGEADVVYRAPLQAKLDFYHTAGQYFAGVKVFLKTTQETVKVRNWHRKPYAIRDGKSGQVLFRSTMTDPEEMQHQLGEGRLISLTLAGSIDFMSFEGISPFMGPTRAGWFEPPPENRQ